MKDFIERFGPWALAILGWVVGKMLGRDASQKRQARSELPI
jgi:hypothetical protein